MPKAVVMEEQPGKPGAVYFPLKIVQVPRPDPGEGQVVVKMLCAALNRRDMFARQRLYPGAAGNVPILADGVGVVKQCGPNVSEKEWMGKRVILTPARGWADNIHGPEGAYAILGGTKFLPDGCCQEYLSVPVGEIEECPSFLSDEEAAATPLAALTAWRATIIKAAIKPGDQVLITGIGGGVAIFCLQIAVAYGAKVYVTSGSEEKLSKAKDLGAVGGVNYNDPEWTNRVLEMLPSDHPLLDSVIDSAGGEIVLQSLPLLRFGGIISSYGMTLAPRITFPMQAVMKNIEFKGSMMGSRKEFTEVIQFIGKHKIHPIVDSVYSMDDVDSVDDAFEVMKAGTQFGKLVIRVATHTANL